MPGANAVEATASLWSDEEEACPSCGLTRRELYQHGQMGCARCYETFGEEVRRALKEIHGETRHLGKNSV